MSDIVERLRRWVHEVDAESASDLMDEAADEIERLARLGDTEPAAERFSGSGSGTPQVRDSRIVDAMKGDINRLLDRIDSSQRTLIFEQEAEIRRLRLTEAEREAIHWVIGDVADITGPVEATLRGLLERLATRGDINA
jgi:hypothetical protein